MKALQLVALSSIAFSLAAFSAEVYRTDTADFEIYGRAKVNMFNGYAYEFTTGKEAHPKLYGSAQLGVSGSTAVPGSKTRVFANLIYDLSAEDSDDVEDRIRARYGYVGVQFEEAGRLLAGRTRPAIYKTIGLADVYTDWGSQGNAFWGLEGEAGGRQDGLIMYDLDINGFSFTANYQFRDNGKNLRDGWSSNLGYEWPQKFGITGGIYGFDAIDDDAPRTFSDKKEYAIGIYYGAFASPGFYTAIVYDHAKLKGTTSMDDDRYRTDGGDFVLSWTSPKKAWTVIAGYSILKDQSKDSGEAYRIKQIVGNVTWNLTDNANLYVEYADNFGEGEHSTAHRDILTLGAIYNF